MKFAGKAWILVGVCLAASVLLAYWQHRIASIILLISACALIGYSFRREK